MASPQRIMAWLPLVREIVDLGVFIAERIRARRAKRKARSAKK